MANTNVDIILGMPFLTFSNVDIVFADQKLTWRSYIMDEALSTIRQIEFIDKKKFAKVALDENVKAFIIHMSSLSLESIHLDRQA